MRNKNRKNIEYPIMFMRLMKKKKNKKIRTAPIDKKIIEQYYNDAERII